MKPLYCLNNGETFWHGGVMWRVVRFDADTRYCRPTYCPNSSPVEFHCDTVVRVDEF